MNNASIDVFPRLSRDATALFLTALFGSKLACTFILLWTLADKRSHWCPTVEDAIDTIEANEGRTIYVGVGLSPKDYGPGNRCPSDDITGIVALTADIDVAHPVHTKTNLPPTREDVERLLSEFGLESSIIVDSGHGVHAWWLLDRPYTITSPSDRQRVQQLAEAWNRRIQQIAAAYAWEVDSTFDLARLLRIPGTINANHPDDPKPVTMLQFEPDRRYSLEAFEQHVGAFARPQPPTIVPEPEPSAATPAACSAETSAPSTSDTTAATTALIISPDAEPPQAKFVGMMIKEGKFAASWHHERTDLTDTSNSAYDQSLADLAARNGWTDQEIVNLLIAHRRQYSDGPQAESYFRVTLAKARAAKTPGLSSASEGLVKRLADAIAATAHFAHDDSRALYAYEDGVYVPAGDDRVKRAVRELLEAWGESARWKKHLAGEVEEYIRLSTPRLWDRPPMDEINVTNGILHVLTRNFRPHDPSFLTTVRIPVAYDPVATCPHWERFVAEVLPPDCHHLLDEVAADIITPVRDDQRAILLYGQGSNGKSRLLAGLTAFAGSDNVSSVSLQSLEHERFRAATLVGRLANVCADLPSSQLSETSVFKAITGGDAITVEHKFGQPFTARLFSRLIFSANQLPMCRDGGYAFLRRWLVIPFERQFTDAEQIPTSVIDRMLAAPAELSGLLNRALDAMPRLRQHGFSDSISTTQMQATFQQVTDPLAIWLDAMIVDDPDGVVGKAHLLASYRHDCQRSGRPVPTPEAFGRAVKRVRPGIREVQRTFNGQPKTRCYLGIRLTGDLSR